MKIEKLLIWTTLLTCILSSVAFAGQQLKEKHNAISGNIQAIANCEGYGMAGYSYENTIANSRQLLQGKENSLDAWILYARTVNKDTQYYISRLEKQVMSITYKIDELQGKINRNEISKAVLLQAKQCISAQLHEAKKNQSLVQKELAGLRQFRATTHASNQLDAEIHKLEENLTQVKKNTAAFAAQAQRI